MAQFKTDFSEYAVGSGVPSDWTPIWVTTNQTWSIKSLSGALGGQVLEHTSTADARRLIEWNKVGTVSGDFDILFKFRTTDSISGNIPARVFACASGTATQTTQQGYQLDTLFPNTIRIGRTTNGTYSTRVTGYLAWNIQPNTWYWYRFRKTGTLLEGRMWADGTTEPTTWDVSVTDTSLTSGAIGIGSYDFDGTRDYDFFSVGTSGDVAPGPVVAPPPDTTAPAEISNLIEKHIDVASDFTWTNPTVADFAQVKVYRNGVFEAGNIANGHFTDTTVSPSTTYVYRFTTVDVAGNESPGTEISVTTSNPIEKEHLSPIEIVSINNLTPNDVTYIQDDPSAEDANVMVPIDKLSNPSVRVKFEAPNAPISGLQTIRWVVDDPSYVGSLVRVYENGTQILESATQYPLSGTQPVIFVFDSDAITDKTLQNVEVEFVSTLYQGLTVSNLGAIEWTTALQQVEVPINGSISGISGASASLQVSKVHALTGSIVASSGATANLTDVQANHVLTGTISAVSNVAVEVLNKSISIDGIVAASSDVQVVIATVKGLSGDIAVQSNVLATQLQKMYEINGDIAASSALSGSLVKLTAIEGQTQSFSDGSGFLDRTTLLQGSVNAFSSVIDASLPVLRGLNGAISVSSDVTGHIDLQGQVTLIGRVTSQSSLTANLSKFVQFSGDILGVSALTVKNISLVKPINGNIAAFSDARAAISKKFGIDGSIMAISSISGSMSVLIGETFLSGEIHGVTSLQGELDRFIDLSGSIEAVSDLLSDLFVGGQQFALEGIISVISGAEVRPPVNLFLEVDDAGYDGVEILEDGLSLSHSINEGLGRHIQFEFEFIVDPNFLEKIEFRVKGTPGQPFYLRAWNYSSNRWDTTNQAVYDGQLDSFASLVIRDFDRYLDANNKVRIAMKSMKGYTNGTLTLSTDYAELRKSYFQ